MEHWVGDLDFERQGPLRRALKTMLVEPLANYLPADLIKAVLRLGKSELAAANWVDPGGWRSMVISYDGRPKQVADKVLIGSGTMAMALRNRRRLGGRLLARLIDQVDREPAHVLCLGAGPGLIIMDAMRQARREAHATLVDLSSDAFEYGRRLAAEAGLDGKLRFIKGDVRDVEQMLDHPPDIVKMLGICEYLTDTQIVDVARSVGAAMPAGAPIVFNSLSTRHGTDRFFRRVFGLHMRHRSPGLLRVLMARAGFRDFVSVSEPLGIYHVIVGRRASEPDSGPSEGSS